MNQDKKQKGDIVVLEMREAIRKRPAIYIGSNGEMGLHYLVTDVIDSFVNEALRGQGKGISLTIHADNSVSIESDHKGIAESLAEIESLLTGETFPDSTSPTYSWKSYAYVVSNCLSEWLDLYLERDGLVYKQSYEKGIAREPLAATGTTDQIKTKIIFKPDASIFTTTHFRSEMLIRKLREKAFLNKTLTFYFTDERTQPPRAKVIHYSDGLISAVKRLNELSQVRHEPIYFAKPIGEDAFALELAFQYVFNFNSQILSYANQVDTPWGGSHVRGLLKGIAEAINQYAQANEDDDRVIKEEHVRSGLTAIVAVKMEQPEFAGSMRQQLVSEIEDQVSAFVAKSLSHYFQQNPDIARRIWFRVRENIPYDDDDE